MAIVRQALAYIRKRWFSQNSDDMNLLIRIVREYGLVHWKRYLAVILLMTLAAGCTSSAAYIMGYVINTIYARRQFLSVVALAASMIGLFTIRGFATYAQAVMLARIGNQVVAETQRRLVDKLLQESLTFFSSMHSSEIAARANNGSGAATNVLNLLVLTLGRDLLTFTGLAVVMIKQDLLLTIIGFCVMPLAVVGIRELVRQTRNVSNRRFSGSAAIMQILQETVQGIRVVKAFTAEDRVRLRLEHEIENVSRTGDELARLANRSSPLLDALGGISVALVLLYSGYRVVELGEEPGRFVSFITAFLLAFDPARRIARIRIDLSGNLIAAQTIFSLIDSPGSEPDESHRPPLLVTDGRVTFSDVTFAYRSDCPVLRDLSFVAEPDQLTALVGPSGGGKSTILALLMRFYEPQGGLVKIDGHDIRDVSRRSLREQIAYVGQDVFLFRGTIRDNILIGRATATQGEVEAAARAAFAHDFIMAFPRGYDSEVGEFGWQLSLGQRQRIAIARALLKDTRVVLLDEPTASLDSESEEEVQKALRHLCTGRTTIVIAHRLTTIRRADRIHVVDEGAIVESGSEAQLRARNGRYETYFRLQFAEAAQERRHSDGAQTGFDGRAQTPASSVAGAVLETP